MFDRLKRFLEGLDGGDRPSERPGDELATAVAVLLSRAAALDGGVDDREREIVAGRLAERYGVSKADLDQVMAEAAQTADEMVDLYGFTRTIKDRLEHDGRVELMEALWEVVYADGALHEYEAQLMRRLAGLLFVEDRESGEARKRALARLGMVDEG